MLDVLVAGFVLPMLISATSVPLMRRLAPRLGLVDQPGQRKVHVIPTPRSGGVAVWFGMVATLLIFAILMQWATGGLTENLRSLARALQGNSERLWQMLAVGVGACVLFAVGLADDRWNLSWRLRLGIQLAVAVGVVGMGVRATVLISHPWVGWMISVVWILVLTNALNFLDNMDALSAGIGVIASIICATILVALVQTPMWTVAVPLMMLAGSLTGFLFWNRPPATIFMGDCGSNLIGFLLATLTIVGTFYEYTGSRHVILAPVCVLAVPLYDFCTVILIRLRQGRSPFHGDKSHFSHRLVDMGLRPGAAVLTIYLATLMTGLGGVLLYKVTDWSGAGLVLALIACVLSIVAILETVGRHSMTQWGHSMANRGHGSGVDDVTGSAASPAAASPSGASQPENMAAVASVPLEDPGPPAPVSESSPRGVLHDGLHESSISSAVKRSS